MIIRIKIEEASVFDKNSIVDNEVHCDLHYLDGLPSGDIETVLKRCFDALVQEFLRNRKEESK